MILLNRINSQEQPATLALPYSQLQNKVNLDVSKCILQPETIKYN